MLGYWLLPLPTIDPIVVARSGAALASYGPDFRYSHSPAPRRARRGWRCVAVATIGAVAQVPPPELLLGRIKQGDGPDEASAEVVVQGRLRRRRRGGQTVRTRVSGGDPGYGETAKMLGESALCLALDDNPPTAGQVTTAQAMGENLLARLQSRASGSRYRLSRPSCS